MLAGGKDTSSCILGVWARSCRRGEVSERERLSIVRGVPELTADYVLEE